jgi:hypothetical protein
MAEINIKPKKIAELEISVGSLKTCSPIFAIKPDKNKARACTSTKKQSIKRMGTYSFSDLSLSVIITSAAFRKENCEQIQVINICKM